MGVQSLKGAMQNGMNKLTGSFGGWRRCSLVTDPCGYAPRSRVACRQNRGVIVSMLFRTTSLGSSAIKL